MPRALAWLSVVLGMTEAATPGVVSRLVGAEPTPGTRALLRAVGARELAAGAGIFAAEPTPFLWARVAGDAMDLALVALAVRAGGGTRRRAVPALAALVALSAVDVVAAARHTAARGGTGSGREREGSTMQARSTVTVNRDPGTVYSAWRDLARLPEFMAHVESVTVADGRSHWVARAPAGTTVEWDAEITDDVPGERVAWRSVEGSGVGNRGEVRFVPAPGGRGTEVHVELTYEQPAGAAGAVVATLFGEHPHQQVLDDLRRFKQLVETGEVARSDGAPFGTRTPGQLVQRAARPLDDAGAAEEVPA
jgi:uncharacterized membrane protein